MRHNAADVQQHVLADADVGRQLDVGRDNAPDADLGIRTELSTRVLERGKREAQALQLVHQTASGGAADGRTEEDIVWLPCSDCLDVVYRVIVHRSPVGGVFLDEPGEVRLESGVNDKTVHLPGETTRADQQQLPITHGEPSG